MVVWVKSPPPPPAEESAATTSIGPGDAAPACDELSARFAAVNPAAPAAVPGSATWAVSSWDSTESLEASGVPCRQAATWGVVRTQAGRTVRCRRDAQSPPKAAANDW